MKIADSPCWSCWSDHIALVEVVGELVEVSHVMTPTSLHDAITMLGYHLSQLFVWALSFSHDVANVTISVSIVVVVILTTGVVPGVLPEKFSTCLDDFDATLKRNNLKNWPPPSRCFKVFLKIGEPREDDGGSRKKGEGSERWSKRTVPRVENMSFQIDIEALGRHWRFRWRGFWAL